MSELERARAHLLAMQRGLYGRRAFGWIGPGEDDVLAALSWVWEAQANDALHNAERYAYPAGQVPRMHEMFGRDLARYALPS